MTTNEVTSKSLIEQLVEKQVKKANRTIHELLNLDSYSDMTDSEIADIINYYMDLARNDEEIRTMQATQIMEANARCEAYEQIAKDSHDALVAQLTALGLDDNMDEEEGDSQ